MLVVVIGYVLIYLITDGQAVVLAAQCSYGGKLSGAEHLPGGVMRAIDYNGLGFWVEGTLQLLDIQTPSRWI